MKNLRFIVIALLVVTLQNCSDNDDNPENNICNLLYVIDASAGLFNEANGYSLQTMDNRIHRLSVNPTIGGKICGISYKNAPGYTGTYEFKILVSNQIRYQGNLSFSQNAYQEISIPEIAFNANETIEIIRTCYSPNPSDWVGEVFRRTDYSDITFPLTHGNIVYNFGWTYDDPAILETNAPYSAVVPVLLLTFKAN